MKIIRYIYLLLAFIVFMFPKSVKAETGKIFFYAATDTGSLKWVERNIELPNGLTNAESALYVLEGLFEDEKVMFIPFGTRILAADITDGHLWINVSDEILDYGGSFYEYCLRNQIIRTGLNLPEVDRISLTIENLREAMAEGSVICEETTWTEPYDVIGSAPEPAEYCES